MLNNIDIGNTMLVSANNKMLHRQEALWRRQRVYNSTYSWIPVYSVYNQRELLKLKITKRILRQLLDVKLIGVADWWSKIVAVETPWYERNDFESLFLIEEWSITEIKPFGEHSIIQYYRKSLFSLFYWISDFLRFRQVSLFYIDDFFLYSKSKIHNLTVATKLLTKDSVNISTINTRLADHRFNRNVSYPLSICGNFDAIISNATNIFCKNGWKGIDTEIKELNDKHNIPRLLAVPSHSESHADELSGGNNQITFLYKALVKLIKESAYKKSGRKSNTRKEKQHNEMIIKIIDTSETGNEIETQIIEEKIYPYRINNINAKTRSRPEVQEQNTKNIMTNDSTPTMGPVKNVNNEMSSNLKVKKADPVTLSPGGSFRNSYKKNYSCKKMIVEELKESSSNSSEEDSKSSENSDMSSFEEGIVVAEDETVEMEEVVDKGIGEGKQIEIYNAKKPKRKSKETQYYQANSFWDDRFEGLIFPNNHNVFIRSKIQSKKLDESSIDNLSQFDSNDENTPKKTISSLDSCESWSSGFETENQKYRFQEKIESVKPKIRVIQSEVFISIQDLFKEQNNWEDIHKDNHHLLEFREFNDETSLHSPQNRDKWEDKDLLNSDRISKKCKFSQKRNLEVRENLKYISMDMKDESKKSVGNKGKKRNISFNQLLGGDNPLLFNSLLFNDITHAEPNLIRMKTWVKFTWDEEKSEISNPVVQNKIKTFQQTDLITNILKILKKN